MSEPKWTPSQIAAIEDRGGALLVSAAAGSGKTAVLTERAVRLITDPDHPVDADKLLIVTFTKAAAAELRARIGQALLSRSQADPGNTSLRRQQMLLQRAPICTIDAFCLELLRHHFQALDLPPDFAPGDAGTLGVLKDAALSETLEKAYQNADFCAFADLYGKGRSDNKVEDIILSFYDFLRSMPHYDRKLEEYLAPWQAENGFDKTGWHDLLLRETARKAEAAVELLEAAIQDIPGDLEDARQAAAEKKKTPAAKERAMAAADKKYATIITEIERSSELMKDVRKLALAGDWTALYNELNPCDLNSELFSSLNKNKVPAGEHKDVIHSRYTEAKALFDKIPELISCSEEEAESDRQQAQPLLTALFEVVRDFDARFAAKKRENKVLEFSDFEHEALRLLQDADGQPTALCQEIRRGYAAVMVDEYQDTNALQDALYHCLALPSGEDLFLVGDLKQSIYRFRQAEPGIFRAKLESWPPLENGTARHRSQQAGESALLALDANFRSAPQVVAGINYLFEQLMTPNLGDTAYGDGQRLVCGAPGEYKGSVEACFLQDNKAATDAAWVAQRIARLVAEKTPVRCGGNGEMRPVRYEDICILMSTRTNFPAFVQAMAAQGIPTYADVKENLFDAPHIRPLIALLRILDNPAQDIDLAAAMLGPMFGFTDDDLVRLRATQKTKSLYGAVLAQASSGQQDELTAKLQTFVQRLTELRRMARSTPADQLLEEIFVSTGYLAALGNMENGARRRDDANRFAAFCAQAGAGGISALVRKIEAAAEAEGNVLDTTPGSTKPGCVTIMTIHRSKGLQFPVVFVVNTGHGFNKDDQNEPVLTHRKYGVGLRLRTKDGSGAYKTAAYTAIAAAHDREMRSEQMRLLYVALTRAQDKLILTIPKGIGKESNKLAKEAAFLSAGAAEALHEQGDSFGDWLRQALLVHPNGGALRTLSGNRELPFVDTDSVIDLTVQEDADEDVPIAAFEEVPITEADPALVAALRQGFDWKYPAAALADVPAKVSVTSIVHRSEQTSLERPAFLSKDGLTAAEMGTALHAFLEHADFGALAKARKQGGHALSEAIQAERQRQVEARLTRPEIAEKLDAEKIRTFVEGEIFDRICKADEVMRELAFITSLPASVVTGREETGLAAGASVLVQGIADLVLVYPDHLELLDYKTDHRKTEAEFLRSYRKQLELYALAIEKRFAPRRVTYKAIYSLELGRLIEA